MPLKDVIPKKLRLKLFGSDVPVDLEKDTSDLPPDHYSFAGQSEADIKSYMSEADNTGFAIDEISSVDQELPLDRLQRYSKFDVMAKHHAIHAALEFYLNTGLSSSVATGEVLSIQPAGDSKKESDELQYLEKIFNKNINSWMYGACKNGVSYVLPYLEKGKGITSIRYDYYTRPEMIKEYEKGGTLRGYIHKSQIENNTEGKVLLLPPWRFAAFKMPASNTERETEPLRKNKYKFDITAESPVNEDPIETQNYGRSLIEAAYKPWISYVRAMISLDIARENAGKKERLITVNTAGMSLLAAANYFASFLAQLAGKRKKRVQKAQAAGGYTSVENTVLPVKGEVGINSEVNSPDIAHIEDVTLRISALAGSLGIDKSQLGFTEDLAGGLGEGGWHSVSLMAASKAQSIRHIATDTLNYMCELHMMWKFGTVYEDGKLPWKIVFNSMTTAVEQEDQRSEDMAINSAIQELTLKQMIDPNGEVFDQVAYVRQIYIGKLGYSEEDFNKLLAKAGSSPPPTPEDDPSTPPILDSASKDAVEKHVVSTLNSIFEEAEGGDNA